MYQGKRTEFDTELLKRLGHGPTVVLQLAIKNSLNSNRILTFDNFFSSYNLFEALSFYNIKSVGTVRIDRFVKPPLLDLNEIRKLGRGTTYEYHVWTVLWD